MNRRDLLLGALASVPARALMQSARPVLTRPIPSTGEALAVVGLGTWQTFDVGNDRAARTECAATLQAFLVGGGRVIDSSPMYGSSEQVVGDLLTARGGAPRPWLATKVWTTGERAGVEQMNTSLRRLQVDTVDLMQIHNLVDWRTHLRTLRAWKSEGRVRYIGLTHYQAGAHDDLVRAMQSETVDLVQVNLSLDEPQAATSLLAACAARKVGVIINRPFGGGASFARVRARPLASWATELGVSSWAQFMLAWILSFPEVTCVIPGTRRAPHVVDTLGAGRLPPLGADVRERMAAEWTRLSA